MIKSSFELIKDDIVTHVADHLDSHKQITGEILFVNQIPHNPQGKKLRDRSKLKIKLKYDIDLLLKQLDALQ